MYKRLVILGGIAAIGGVVGGAITRMFNNNDTKEAPQLGASFAEREHEVARLIDHMETMNKAASNLHSRINEFGVTLDRFMEEKTDGIPSVDLDGNVSFISPENTEISGEMDKS